MASSKKKKKKVEAPVKYEGSVIGNALKNTMSGENTKRGNIWGLITGSPLGSMFGNIIDESEKKKELSKSNSQINEEKNSNKNIEQAKIKSDESYNKLNEYKKQKGINLFNESKFKNDEEYQTLLKNAQNDIINKQQTTIKEKTKTKKFDKGIVGGIEKGEYALASGFERGIQGIESTTEKILGQTPETPRTTIFESMDEKARKTTKSKVGQMGLDVLGSVGQMLPQMAVGNPTGAIATGFANYGGSAYNEAKKNGASEKQATMYGIVSGSTEMLMEKVLGGFENVYGKKMGKDFTKNVMTKLVKNKAVRQTLSNMKGEFTEEYLQQFLEPIMKNIILKENNGADFWNTMKDDIGEGLKQLGKQFFNSENFQAGFEGAMTSGIMEGPRNLALDKQGFDVETGRTKNSQSVYDAEVNERIKEAEKDGKKLSNKEKSKIEQEVKEDLENGQIGIDRIESSLGGETYNKYKELQDKISSLKEEQTNLKNKPIQESTLGDSERLKQIESEISQIDDSRLKQQLSEEVRELVKDDELLQRSYIEKDNKSKEFIYEGTDNDTDITKAIIESTKGKLNNTKKAHNLVDALIKIGNDRGIAYKLTNSEELKQMGLSQEGKTTNGVYVADNGEIYVNLDSKNYLEQILVHETTHTLEKANAYEDLQRLAKEFSEKSGTYEKIRQEIEENYSEKDWDSETTARILEDNLGNEDFIKELTNQKPSVVQKIIDTIKYLKKQFSTSSAEARKLNKLQYQMEQAYKKAYNEQSDIKNNNETKFSIQTDEKGNKYVNVDVNQDIFKNKSLSEQIKLAKDIIKNNFVGKEFNIDNDTGIITNRTSKEYTHPSKKLDEQIYSDKLKASTEFNNIIEISKYIKSEEDDGRHAFAKEGWKYYETKFKVGDNVYKGVLNVANDGNKNTIYDITKIENITKKQTGTRSTSADAFTTSSSLVKNNISQLNKNVKSDISTKYSIQENENNTQELDKSSFSNTKYSVSNNTDNQGRKLSEKQQEYFKDSKVRDEKGNLRVLYNGSGEHTIFNPAYMSDESKWGKGIYLTPFKDVAEQYGSNIKEVYVDIKNPLEPGKSITFEQYNDLYKAINDGEEAYREEYDMYDDDLDLLWDITNKGSWADYADEIIKYTGKDGIIVDDPEFDKADIMVIAFKSNQVKNIDNTNPTENDDIRYSKGDIAPTKRKGTLGKEVKLDNQTINKDTLAPIKGEVRYSLNEKEKNELEGLKAVEESGLASKEDINRIKQLEKKEKVPKKIEKARENYVENKVDRAIRKQAYKNINIATKIAQDYLSFNADEKRIFKSSLIDLTMQPKEKIVNKESYNEVKEIINQFANKEYTFVDKDLKNIKSQVRNTKINIPEELKKQITDYSDFRKESKLNISKNGQNIDTIWQELSNNYPYIFSNDIETEADMLYALSDFMNKDIKITEKYKIPDKDLKIAVDKVYNKIIDNSLTQEDINSLEKDIEVKAERRTRQVVQNELLKEMGITIDDIDKGNDISSIAIQRTDPIRLNEKVFGYETGKKINDATINKTKHNEAERTRWLNKERDEIKELGIKARSKESEAVQKYGEKQWINDKGDVKEYGDAQLREEFPNVETQNKIKHASEVIRKKYDSYIEQINDVLVDMGYDPIPKRKDYFRHFYEINDKLSQWGVPFNKNDMNSDVLPTDINGLTDEFKPGKSWFANSMERKGMKTTYDAITGIDGYLESASNVIFHTGDIQRYRTLSKFIRENYGAEHGMENIEGLDEKEFNKRLNDIQNNKLSKYVAWLDEQANALAGKKGAIDRSMERFLGRKVYTALNTLKSQVGSNMTGFNVRSALTNFASAVQGASKTNKISFIKGTLSTLNNIVHDDGMINKSDFLTTRFGSDSLSKKMWQKVSNAGQIFMTGTDYFTSNQIWRSKYYENISKGMSETQAIKNADDFSSRIMGDRSKGSTAEIFNSKTLGLLTQFQLEVNNQWSSMIHDNKMDVKSGNKSGAMVVFQLGQLFGASYLFNNLMKSLTGSDVMFDPIDLLKDIFKPDDEDKTLEERTTEALGKVVDQLPMASIFTGGRIPISEAFKGVSTGFKYATGQSNQFGQKYTPEDIKDDFLESVAYWLLPTGYGQIRKTTKGLSMYDDKLPVKGSYTKSGNLRFSAEDTIQERIKASLFGQYATKYSQDYINSGYKSIDKRKLDEMKDLKMNSTEYRDYRKGLSDAGTKKEEKLNFINKLNISNKKKNIMASNVMKRDINMKEYNKYNSYEEFDYAYKNPDKYRLITTITDYDTYKNISNNINDIKADVDRNGNAISGSRMKKVINYVNSLNMSAVQKAMLIKQEYPSFKQYDNQIAQYINKQNLNFIGKAKILKSLGFKSYDNQIIEYVKNTYKTIEEQQEILKDLGFKIYTYNGRTYVKR